ncbi:MAG: hypothetical protein O7D91_01985 [Planctomycetota bacterium]|nr:hypothetical protein [Planctomycetota bacterium]
MNRITNSNPETTSDFETAAPKPSDNGESNVPDVDEAAAQDTVSSQAPDPFDPARFRLSQDFQSTLGVKKALLTVPVRKPSKEWWVQTHPDAAYWMETMVLELKEDREVYLVEPELWSELATESTFVPKALILTINRQQVPILWPIRLPGADGKLDDWNRSAIEAAKMAQGQWVRVQANMSLGAYDVYQATGDLSAPDWPEPSMAELLRVAFKNYHITTQDHPVLRKLRGEL